MTSEDIAKVLLALIAMISTTLGPIIIWMLNEVRKKQNTMKTDIASNTELTAAVAEKVRVDPDTIDSAMAEPKNK